MTTVCCVLRSGGDFEPKHAARLYDQFLEHAPQRVEFLCLTDRVDEVEALHVPAARLEHDWPGSPERLKRFNIWPGFWAKMEVYKVPGPVLYLDLDVTIIGDLSPLLAASRELEFVCCADFWVGGPHFINTSVVAWAGSVDELYREFAAAPKAHMSVYQTREMWGDQSFVRDHWRRPRLLWQDILPGMVLSYKLDVLKGSDWSDARVICSHGKPRPWDSDGADYWLMRKKRVA